MGEIFTVAFEGAHRAGKGTQIELLSQEFRQEGIPFVSVRGEGYRSGIGTTDADPSSEYWQRLSAEIKQTNDYAKWDEASYRLGRELLVWKNRILERKVEENLAPFGVLLIDRSLLSRGVLMKLNGYENHLDNGVLDLYPNPEIGKGKVTEKSILPDVIFELIAPKEVLLSRLDPADPYFEFRQRSIEENYDSYLNIKHELSVDIIRRITTIDSSRSVEEVHEDIMKVLRAKFAALRLS